MQTLIIVPAEGTNMPNNTTINPKMKATMMMMVILETSCTPDLGLIDDSLLSNMLTSQQIQLTNDECFEVQPGDRLGLTVDVPTVAVGFLFKATGSQFAVGRTGLGPPKIDDIVTFDSFHMPYEFAVGAAAEYDPGIRVS